jgi:hypothetical protein
MGPYKSNSHALLRVPGGGDNSFAGKPKSSLGFEYLCLLDQIMGWPLWLRWYSWWLRA